uniref:Uncharacterized protein n=1 Tax=uncultured marine thaumarchaeote KM3_82_D05 TaxID=1456304 RepID=A0A075HVA6_9ARCH|nr:hypothetical protein [uncultured marine thaumarchaeote KM3_82_D05]
MFYRSQSARYGLVTLGARHPSEWYVLGRDAQLGHGQIGQPLSPPPQYALMGPEELVRGAGQIVAPGLLDVHEQVRGIVDGIHEHLRTDLVRLPAYVGHVVDCARQVRCRPHCNQYRVLVNRFI